jgi:hypothetical protein
MSTTQGKFSKIFSKVVQKVVLYNMNGFRIETMYDYYIVMKSMFLVVKLSSHLIIGYASLTILLS